VVQSRKNTSLLIHFPGWLSLSAETPIVDGDVKIPIVMSIRLRLILVEVLTAAKILYLFIYYDSHSDVVRHHANFKNADCINDQNAQLKHRALFLSTTLGAAGGGERACSGGIQVTGRGHS
jgi:hypothetical protein